MTAQTMPETDILAENIKLMKTISLLNEKIDLLQQQLDWFKRQIFGKRSEKIVNTDDGTLYLPGMDPSENPKKVEPETEIVPTHIRRKPIRDGKDKVTLPEDLPIERTVLDIPEEEKFCKETGEALVKIGEEVSQKLAKKPNSYFIREIVRPKYAAPKNPEAGIVTAALPESLFSGCQVDESFLADLLVNKYADHLPLYRQSEILSRAGIFISRQLLCQWTLRAGLALKPLHEEMKRLILESKNAFADETPIKMLDPGKGKTKQAYMWILAGGNERNPPYRIYEFYEDRKHSNAKELLKDYDGVLHSDKYGAYEALANLKQFTWCPCWAHIRRKFFDVESGDLEFRDWCLRKIRYLFMLERVAWERSPEERLKIRQEKEAPIIDEMIAKIKTKLLDGKLLPKSNMRTALGYFLGLVPYLKNYTRHPFAHLDNNVAERSVRPLAVGRKNWLFVGNEAGGDAAAVIYSLIQTCRALSINPREYLEDVMRRLMSHSAHKLSELLPDQWAARRSAA